MESLSNSLEEKKYRLDIQVLRGLAIILVVAYHLGIAGFQNGFLGVDIFFVLSGYLMAQTFQGKSIREYLKRRALRLLPAYTVVIFTTTFVCAAFLAPADFSQTFSQAFYSLILLPNFYFWSRNSYFHHSDFNPLLNLWSLGVELQFYLIVPIVAFLFNKSRFAFKLIMAVSLFLMITTLMLSPKTAFFLLPFRIWEFLLGFMVAKLCFSNFGRISSIAVYTGLSFSLTLVLYLLFVFQINGSATSAVNGHPGLGSIGVGCSTALMLLVKPKIPLNIVSKMLGVLGNYSYSLYLVHFPIIVLLNYKPFSGTLLGFDHAKKYVLFLLLCSISTFCLNQYIEERFRRFEKSLVNKRSIQTSLITLIILFVSTTPLNALGFTDVQRKISHAIQDRDVYRCGKLARILNPFAKMCQIVIVDNSTNEGILLLGNSHADSIKSAVKREAKRHAIPLFFWVQNDPLMAGGSDIDMIVTHAREANVGAVLYHYSEGAVSIEVFTEFKSKLYEKGIALIVIGPVPTWNQSVPYLLWNFDKGQSSLLQTYAEYRKLHPQLIYFESSTKRRDFTFYDIGAFLCKPNCRFVDNQGKPLYFDSNHLNLSGARFIQPFIEEIFNRHLLISAKGN